MPQWGVPQCGHGENVEAQGLKLFLQRPRLYILPIGGASVF